MSRIIKRRYALLIAFVGLLPDIDVLLRIHRWVTHSIVAPLIITIVAVVIYWCSEGKIRSLMKLLLISTFIYVLHIVMDLFTAPTPILWPILKQSYMVSVDVEGSISINYIGINPEVKVITEPSVFIQRSLIEGPIISCTGILVSITIITYELLHLIILRRK